MGIHCMGIRFPSLCSDHKVTKYVLFLFSSEPMWPIEARCASIANNYFTVAINRIGTVSAVCFNPFFWDVFVMKSILFNKFSEIPHLRILPSFSNHYFFTTNRKCLKMSLHQEMANQVIVCL